jgi:hypothetical protein
MPAGTKPATSANCRSRIFREAISSEQPTLK